MPLHQPDPDLTDGTVTLRRWRTTDLRCIELAATDPDIPRGTTVPAHPSDAEGLAFVERQHGRLDSGQGLSLAVVPTGSEEAVGLVVLMHRPKAGTVEVGYWLVPTARGRGLAARAVRLLADWALTEADVARVEALVHPDNVASLRTLASAGFAREGVLRSALPGPGHRSDAVVWSRISEDVDRT